MISESFTPINTPSDTDISGGYSELTKLSEGLFRAKKAGKFFILKTAKDTSARSVNLLKREYGLTVSLSHPHIVNVFTFDEATPAGPAIVMEYVEGRTLDRFLEENPTRQVRNRIFLQLLDAVEYIHRSGLIHNDLKPENIIITYKDNDLKLIDFGLSDDDSNFLETHLGGTRGYASPELLSCKKESATQIDSRSDIYSIGMLMKDIFPSSLSRIKAKCTSQDRTRRYSNVEELKLAFSHRHLPYHIATAAAIIALILLPTFLLLRERNRLSEANSSISALRHHSDSLNLIQEAANKRNRIIDSIGNILEKEFSDLYDSCLISINKEWGLANKGLHPHQTYKGQLKDFGVKDWGMQWMNGEQRIADKTASITKDQGSTPEVTAFISDAVRSRYRRIQEDTYQHLYEQSFAKAEFERANKQ